jgi:predicted regulator of Ras-like GTPase activity (Roadblock/LC7/MglB family)
VIQVLQPLAALPGVEYVMLVSYDGVPIAHLGGTSEGEREQSLAALATAWLNDVSMAVAPLTWSTPERVCLRAARGTLLLRRTDSAFLVVLLGREVSPENLRLPMDGVMARLERARTSRTSSSSSPDGVSTQPTGPIPYRPEPSAAEEEGSPAPQPGLPPSN